MFSILSTSVGSYLFSLSPKPNSPYIFRPQVYTFPFTVTAKFPESVAEIRPISLKLSTLANVFIFLTEVSLFPVRATSHYYFGKVATLTAWSFTSL